MSDPAICPEPSPFRDNERPARAQTPAPATSSVAKPGLEIQPILLNWVISTGTAPA
jgi:hypothetical protein